MWKTYSDNGRNAAAVSAATAVGAVFAVPKSDVHGPSRATAVGAAVHTTTAIADPTPATNSPTFLNGAWKNFCAGAAGASESSLLPARQLATPHVIPGQG